MEKNKNNSCNCYCSKSIVWIIALVMGLGLAFGEYAIYKDTVRIKDMLSESVMQLKEKDKPGMMKNKRLDNVVIPEGDVVQEEQIIPTN